MANHPSAKKRNRQNQLQKLRNSGVRSWMRAAIREARQALASKAKDSDDKVKVAVTRIYQARSKNIIKPRTASRHVSRLMKAQQNAR